MMDVNRKQMLLLPGLPEPEPVGAGVFGRSRSRNFHPAPAPALASTNTVEIFTNKSPKDFFFTLNY